MIDRIDDIEDNSNLRRGVPAAHTVYGIPLTINTANYAYFICLKSALELDSSTEAARIYSEQLLDLHKGQGMEIWFRDNFICPNEDQYKELVLKSNFLVRNSHFIHINFNININIINYKKLVVYLN